MNTTTEKAYIKIRLSPTEARRYANRQQRYAVRRACRNWRLGRGERE